MTDRGPHQKILSASRRTDLPGWYPDRLVERIRRRVAGFRRFELYGLVLWTRHAAPLLDHRGLARLLEELPNIALNLTITGLGGGPLEPAVPRTAEVVRQLRPLVAGPLHGQPERLRWRFDPVWPRPGICDEFCRIADEVAACGATTCTFSFPTRFGQLGAMGPRYREHGLLLPSAAERADLVGQLAAAAVPRGLRLLCCAQPETLGLLPGAPVYEAQCVPREVLEGLHPRGLAFPGGDGGDPAQRAACRCLPSEELGDYQTDPCGSGCVYCYSRAGGTKGQQRWKSNQDLALFPGQSPS